jgi:hypothetical protein
MYISRVIPASAVAVVMAVSLGAATLSGQSASREVSTTVTSTATESNAQITAPTTTTTLAAVARVKAIRMTSSELDAVKGLHVHFVVPSSQNDQYGLIGLHLAGNPFEHNWSNLGGSDPAPVAPSYRGLCNAAGTGTSAIFIPYPPNFTQCP